jgi:prephenate dehydrogenase
VGAPFGIAELAVLPAVAERLEDELVARGWRVHT